jgi:hypothetical protein
MSSRIAANTICLRRKNPMPATSAPHVNGSTCRGAVDRGIDSKSATNTNVATALKA